MPFVYSTLPNGVVYNGYVQTSDTSVPTVNFSVEILGGAGVADKRIVTPQGVVTEVDEDQIAFLLDNELFKLHQKNGYLVVRDKRTDVEAVVADMQRGDASSPMTPHDLIGDGQDEATEITVEKTKVKKAKG